MESVRYGKEDAHVFEIVVPPAPASLGLQLSPELIVQKVVQNVAPRAVVAHVRVGDALMAMNGTSFDGIGVSRAIEAIQKQTMTWRRLKFRSSSQRRTDTVAGWEPKPSVEEYVEEDKESAWIRVLDIDAGIVAEIPAATALFGKPSACKPSLLVYVDPPHACGALQNAADLAERTAVVTRGGCSFVSKARQLWEAGASAMVVINHNENVIRMPMGEHEDLSGLAITAWMIRASAREAIVDSIVAEEQYVQLYDPVSPHCAEWSDGSAILEVLATSEEEHAAPVPNSPVNAMGGTITFQGLAGEKLVVEFLQFLLLETSSDSYALHGSVPRVIFANPRKGCTADAYDDTSSSTSKRQTFVVVDRGGCPFRAKLLAARDAGMDGVIIINDSPGLLQGKAIDIPAVMITQNAGKALRNAFAKSMRATFQPDATIEMAWMELGALGMPTQWPADASERRKLYKSLSKEHHPDKPGGHAERFEYLRHLYEIADAPAGAMM